MNINYQKLSDLDKSIINAIENQIKNKEKANIQKIATECYTSTATIVKLAKKLGFHGYSELFYSLMTKEKKYASINLETIDLLMQNFEFQNEVNILCELLYFYKDKRIYVDAVGFSLPLRQYFIQRLLGFGFFAIACDHYEIFDVGNPGMYIIFSESGNRESLITKSKIAIKKGYNLLLFTANTSSELGAMAQLCIEIVNAKFKLNEYEPNLFTLKSILILELVLKEYSKRYNSSKITEFD